MTNLTPVQCYCFRWICFDALQKHADITVNGMLDNCIFYLVWWTIPCRKQRNNKHVSPSPQTVSLWYPQAWNICCLRMWCMLSTSSNCWDGCQTCRCCAQGSRSNSFKIHSWTTVANLSTNTIFSGTATTNDFEQEIHQERIRFCCDDRVM